MDINQLPGTTVIGQASGEPDVSALGSFGRGAVSMIPLGDQSYAGVSSLFSHKPYLQERQELEKEKEIDTQENPGSKLLGQAAGVIAPALATGGGSVPESLGGTALEGAGIGSAFGLGNAIDTKASGGTNLQALGDIGLGAGVGALGGIAGKGISNALSAGAEAIGKTQAVQRFMTQERAKAWGITPFNVGRMAQKEGESVNQYVNGLIDRAESLPLPPDIYAATSSINNKQAAVINVGDSEGKIIGIVKNANGEYTYPGATPGEFFPEGAKAIDDLRAAASSYRGINSDVPKRLKDLADSIESTKRQANLDFNTLSQYRETIGAEARSGEVGAAHAYGILSRNLDAAVDRIPPPPGISPDRFREARRRYAIVKEMEPLMSRGAAREAVGYGGGLSRLAGGVGLLTGHPLAAVPAALGAAAQSYAPEAIPNLVAGKSIPKSFGQAISRIPQIGSQIGASQTQPQNKQQIVQDFIKQQTDPNYAKTKKD